jgi:hypothetical protein
LRDFIDYLYIWFITALEIATYTIITAVLVAIFTLALMGCPCPPGLPPRVVMVSKPCPLPPIPSLPTVQTVDGGDPKLFCYDVQRAVLLAQRDSLMRSWIKEVVARCGGSGATDAGVPGDGRSPNRQN